MAIGSVGSSVLAVKVTETKLPIAYWFILPLCVWIIYTSDHLLDALKLKDKAVMKRHYFHYVHRRLISIFLILAIFISILLIMKLDPQIIGFGFIVYFIILGYLLLNHFTNRIFRFFPREFIIALGYMAGTWGIPLLLNGFQFNRMEILFLLNHFLIILSIPLLFSIYEHDADIANNFISFATAFGMKLTKNTFLVLLFISAIFSTISFFVDYNYISLSLLLMTAILFTLVVFRKKFAVDEKYRIIGDSVNYVPFFLLI